MNRDIRNLLILVIVALAAIVGSLFVHTDFVYKTDARGKVTKTVSLTVTPAGHALVVAGADSVKKAPSVTKKAVSHISLTTVIHAHHAVAAVEAVTRDVGVIVFDGVQAVVKTDTAKVDTVKKEVSQVVKDTAKLVDTNSVAIKGSSEIPAIVDSGAVTDTNGVVQAIDQPVSQFAKYERVMFQGVIAAPTMDTIEMTADQHDRAADAAMQAIRTQAKAEKAGQQ